MAYIGKSPTGTGVRSRFYYTQTSGGGTSISGTDDNSKTLTFTDGEYIDVYLNGVLLVAGTDYNTSTANTISGLAALANGDVVEVVVYDIFTVADTVSASQGGTFQGNVVFNGTTTGLDLNGTELVLDADADTSITADTDDNIDFKTGGTDRLKITTDKVQFNVDAKVDTDNTRDLGSSGARWQDLYLGGSLYIGGTGSANALDDYEEGVHTVTLTPSSSGSITLNSGFDSVQYVKIGNICHVSGRVRVTSVSSPTGGLRFSLPFTSANLSEDAGRVFGYGIIQNAVLNTQQYIIHPTAANQSFVEFYKGNAVSPTAAVANDFGGNELVSIALTYRTA